MNMKIRNLTRAAAIAALYVALTYLANALGLANGAVQLRFSEALTVLPAFLPAAVPGLFVGCLLANLLTGVVFTDVICGSLATLIGAIGTRWIAKRNIYLSPIPPIFANTLIVPFVLRFAYGVPDALPYLFLTIFAGEFLSCGVLGLPLIRLLKKRPQLFK